MHDLPRRGQIYLWLVYAAGAVAFWWLMFSYTEQIVLEDWLLTLLLAAASSLSQVLVVARTGTSGQRSDHLTLAPLFAAVLLIPRPLLALLVIWTFLPEWYLRGRSWFGQLFNMAVYLIGGALVKLYLISMMGKGFLTSFDIFFALDVKMLLLTIPLYEFNQIILLSLVLKLARGQSFRTSGLFALDSLMLEFSLLGLGVGFATSWIINPLYGIAAALPMLLIFQALHVPNLKEQAATDAKTGLSNMRYFNEVFARELERATRYDYELSLMVADLDYLRNINNTYGHQVGDTVLIGIADIIRKNIRGTDVAGRFGGEEFVVLLPETGPQGARQLAERMRRELAQTIFDVDHPNGPVQATVSIGVASAPRDATTMEMLMHEADLAVYQAKRDGRNQVVQAGAGSRSLAAEWAREHLVPISTPQKRTNHAPRRPFWDTINQLTRASLNEAEERIRGTANQQRKHATSSDNVSSNTSGARRSDPGRLIVMLSGLVLLAGLGVVGWGSSVSSVPWVTLLLFAVLTMLAEYFASSVAGDGKVSVSTVPILSVAFLYQEIGILVVAIAATTAITVKARSPMYRVSFNLGFILLAAHGAYKVFDFFAPPFTDPRDSLLQMLIPAALAGLAYYAINQVLLCTVRGLAESRSALQIWQQEYRWLWPYYIVLGILALIISLSYLVFGVIGVLALIAPVAMMQLSIQQYLQHTTIYIRELRAMNDRLSDSYEATLNALTRALDTRDDETEAHSQRVSRYTELIARNMGVSEEELDHMRRGALLHDIGKIGVPDAILLKPGALTEEECKIMRSHAVIGYKMIANIPFLAKASQVVLHHHESYDGSGYPSGLQGVNIPLGARIFAVADTFDAITSNRPYRMASSLQVAMREIEKGSGSQFDPVVVKAFQEIPKTMLRALVAHRDAAEPPPLSVAPQVVRPDSRPGAALA